MAFDDDLSMWNENVGLKYNAREYRRLIQQLFGGWGVFPGGLEVQESSPPAMTVKLTDGAGIVPSTTGTQEGLYYARNVGDILDIDVEPSDPSDDRWDLFGVWVRDSEHDGGGQDNSAILPLQQVIAGTPAGSPALPTAPDNFLALAKIVVGAGVTDIITANITSLAPRAPADYQLPNATLTWSNRTTDGDLTSWTVDAEDGWDMLVRQRLSLYCLPNDVVTWDAVIEVWTGANGTGTKLGDGAFRNVASGSQRELVFVECDDFVIPAGTSQVFHLHVNYSSGTPTTGFTPSSLAQNVARIFVKPATT